MASFVVVVGFFVLFLFFCLFVLEGVGVVGSGWYVLLIFLMENLYAVIIVIKYSAICSADKLGYEE